LLPNKNLVALGDETANHNHHHHHNSTLKNAIDLMTARWYAYKTLMVVMVMMMMVMVISDTTHYLNLFYSILSYYTFARDKLSALGNRDDRGRLV
jgi:hypothetical protein